MKWKSRYGYIVVAILLMLLFVDIGINLYIFYGFAVYKSYEVIKKFLAVTRAEKLSIARFQGDFDIMDNFSGFIKISPVLLFGGVVVFMLSEFSVELLPIIDDPTFLLALFGIPFVVSFILEFRYYQFFLLPDGLMQTSDSYLFLWKDFESYSLYEERGKVHFSIKLKGEKDLKFKPRKVQDVDVDAIVNLLNEQNIPSLESSS